MVIVESWHHSSADAAVRRAAPPGFHFRDRPRYDGPLATESGGGIIVYYRDHLKAKKIELVRAPTTFEALAVSLASDRGPTTLLALYRPGSSRPYTTVFYDEFISLMDQFALYNTQLVLVGDLNLHLEDSSLPETMEFVAVLEQFGLKQHVTESTHVSGGWLDVVVTRDDCQVSDVIVSPPTFSDHGPVVATIPFLCEPLLLTMRRVRRWKRLDRAAFRMALRAHPLFADVESSAQLSTSEMFSKYEDALSGLLDTFAPICNIRSRRCPSASWFARVAEPFGDRLDALREFSEKRALRRIEHHGSALSGRCILHIALENRSIGKHLSPTSLRNQKGSGPPSTVSLAVGGVVKRLRIYQRSPQIHFWSALQPRYR